MLILNGQEFILIFISSLDREIDARVESDQNGRKEAEFITLRTDLLSLINAIALTPYQVYYCNQLTDVWLSIIIIYYLFFDICVKIDFRHDHRLKD